MDWPVWWDWELEISSHCLKRMEDRGFTETDLRSMVADAFGIAVQEHGTFAVQTQHNGTPWEVIVAPDDEEEIIIVVTAYPL